MEEEPAEERKASQHPVDDGLRCVCCDMKVSSRTACLSSLPATLRLVSNDRVHLDQAVRQLQRELPSDGVQHRYLEQIHEAAKKALAAAESQELTGQ